MKKIFSVGVKLLFVTVLCAIVLTSCDFLTPKHKHTEGEWVSVLEPTCTVPGQKELHCAECDEVIATLEVAALGHTEVFDIGEAPTCESDGVSQSSYCSTCEEVLQAARVLPALGHTYTDDADASCDRCGSVRDMSCKHKNAVYTPGQPATCTDPGYTHSIYCPDCEEILIASKVVDALGHDPKLVGAKLPTCTEPGYEDASVCSACGLVFEIFGATDAIGHYSASVIIGAAPSETADGYTYKVCDACGEVFGNESIPYVVDTHFTYVQNGTKPTCTITGLNGFTGTDLVVPVFIGEYKVVGIGDAAFKDCAGITSITLPETVETIGDNAFEGCTGLSEIKIPSSVIEIGENIFDNTTLSTVYYNSAYAHINNRFMNVPNITKIVFGGKEVPAEILHYNVCVKEIVVSYGVESIGDFAFYRCTSLKKVELPTSLQSIGRCAFALCESLKGIDLPYNLKTIGNSAFEGAGLESIVIPESVTEIGTRLFAGCASLTNAVISGTNKVSAEAFYDCSSLVTVTLGEGVEVIASRVFYNCPALRTINVPSTLSKIEDGAITNCMYIDSINYNGTILEWNVVFKSIFWSQSSGLHQIVCTDGVTHD